MGTQIICFSDTDLGSFLRASSSEALDELDFGVIGMDRQGVVCEFNRYELKLASLKRENVIGKNFFIQIAPCTNNNLIAGKYLQSAQKTDVILDYIFTYRIKPTSVRLRIIIDLNEKKQFLLVQQQ
jgi:photoactive yellow protein